MVFHGAVPADVSCTIHVLLTENKRKEVSSALKADLKNMLHIKCFHISVENKTLCRSHYIFHSSLNSTVSVSSYFFLCSHITLMLVLGEQKDKLCGLRINSYMCDDRGRFYFSPDLLGKACLLVLNTRSQRLWVGFSGLHYTQHDSQEPRPQHIRSKTKS